MKNQEYLAAIGKVTASHQQMEEIEQVTDSKSQESNRKEQEHFLLNHHNSLHTEATVMTNLVNYPGDEISHDGAIHVERYDANQSKLSQSRNHNAKQASTPVNIQDNVYPERVSTLKTIEKNWEHDDRLEAMR